MTQAIVGSWYLEQYRVAFTFLADGSFLIADKGDGSIGPGGQSGLEWGQYTWNEGTGALAMSFGVNTDGDWGLSHSGVTSATVSGDTLTFFGSEEPLAVPRLLSPPDSVVGSWSPASAGDGGTDQIVFTFLANGTLLVADKGTVAHDPTGTSGIEWGNYTWDPATGAATINIVTNTDGQWGFASNAPETIHMTLHPGVDAMSVLVSDGDGGSLLRLSPLTASTITGTSNADTLLGTGAGDTVLGLEGNDSITGSGGNDTLNGGAGIDTAFYTGARSGYTVSKIDTGFTVAGAAEGTDTLSSVERLHFSDARVALDLDGNAGNVARIIGAVFGSASLSIREYVGIGLGYLDGGMSYQDLMQLAITFQLRASSNSSAAVVNLLYGNVIGGAPSPELLAQYTALLDNHSQTSGSLGVLAASLPTNEAHINLTGLAQTGIEFV
ncbi:MAG: hypothetical protein V4787_10405 [Pseudomonadota bacterium]